ncbi:MAG: DegT/DnrJ/EryC1/StrS family aminotransferase [Spirochaetia bacterium]|nr:DegT/DnrJ/EryC1/StrS family aminotransferase [Spirochaetia bacterium]
MPGPGFYFTGAEEEKEVLEVIRSGHLNRYGSEDDPKFMKKVYTLEHEVAKKFGAKYGLAVTSGTSALIVALQALKIGPGDEVIVPGYTFIASISSIITVGAVPVLAEIDESLDIDPLDIVNRITPRTKAIMAVHMLGNPCAMDELLAIAKKHNLYLIEDTAQAFGGKYKDRYLGVMGDIGTYSFNVYKTINAGDGGLLLTNKEETFKTAFAVHDQGHMPLRTGLEVGNRSVVGQNFRMNELTGAVLLAQFRKIDLLIARLHEIKKQFKDILKKELPQLEFRKLNDERGEIGTLLTVLMPTKETADKLVEKLGTKTISHSGWHVYNNMEQILGKKQLTAGPPFRSKEFPTDVVYEKGMLPRTDAILNRAINISIGVVDAGLGSGFGVCPLSSDEEIRTKAMEFVKAAKEVLK